MEEELSKEKKERLEDQKDITNTMQVMTDAIRSGIRFLTEEQDCSSQVSKKISASKVGQLVKRNAIAAGLNYSSSGTASLVSSPTKR